MQINPQIGQLRANTDAPLVIIADPLDEDAHTSLLEAEVDQVIFRPYSACLLIAQMRVLV